MSNLNSTKPKPPDPTLHHPRILCLHGGGVNAEVFRLQARALIAKLSPYFRLVFADGPFFCDPGPGIVPVYEDYGPFRRWLRWLPDQQEVDASTAVSEIEYCIENAVEADDLEGADGPWVGLLGFSQGAKVAASMLFRQQVRATKLGVQAAGSDWRFAVLLAGRAPLVSFEPELVMNKALVDASQISEGFANIPDDWSLAGGDHILKLPTVHVHGLKDPGLHLHRRLMNQYCDPESTRLVEWDGEHRVPIKKTDVEAVVEKILDLAKETGVLKGL